MSHRCDGHLYGDYKKSLGVNLNARCALVEYGGRQYVFGSIYAAENFCDKNEIDPDDYVRGGDPETVKICRKVAGERLLALEEVMERLDEVIDKQAKKCESAREERDKAERENRRNILGALYDERVTEAVSEYQGASNARKAVREVQDMYQNIIWFAK